jgi:large subunit ribosomal protein L24
LNDKLKSSKPRKQRKVLYEAAWHKRHKMLSALLSKELRDKYARRSLPIRKGDVVRIMRGDHVGEEGKVIKVDYDKYRIVVDGVKRERIDGTTVFLPIHPSKVTLVKLSLDDKIRRKILERKTE